MRIEKKGSRALVTGGRRYVPFLNDALTNFSTRRSRLLGPRAFLANSGRVLATALRPVPPKKRPCAIHARKVGRASNTVEAVSLGRGHFWQTPGACGLRPCARSHPKKGLVPYMPVKWGVHQIP